MVLGQQREAQTTRATAGRPEIIGRAEFHMGELFEMRDIIRAMSKRRCVVLVAFGLALITVTSTWAQPQPASDEAAVRQAAQAYLDAMQRGDGKALAAAWTEQGSFIDPSGQSHPAPDDSRAIRNDGEWLRCGCCRR